MKDKIGKAAITAFGLMLILSGVMAINIGQSMNYQAAYARDTAPQISTTQIGTGNQTLNDSITFRLTVVLDKPSDLFPNSTLLAEGWVPSCSIACSGISYVLDPTVLITDQGRDFEQCKVFGSAGTITCTAADLAQYLSVSVSGGYVPLHGDTACHATVQTADGYSIIAGTIVAGAAGTTVSTTISHTWTDTTASVSNIDLACIQTEASGGGNVILYAEGQIASTSTNIGDSLETIWTISRT